MRYVGAQPREFHAALALVNLDRLMRQGEGSAGVRIGLVDGAVATHQPDFAATPIVVHDVPGARAAGDHGTLVAAILSARRGGTGPGICPGCTLIVRPLFADPTDAGGHGSGVTPATAKQLADAIIALIDDGARIINLSIGYDHRPGTRPPELTDALGYAARRRVLIVAAGGNQGHFTSSPITEHPWVIPVMACDTGGRPLRRSNFSSSVARRGLRAPGDRVRSLRADGTAGCISGSSAAVPFVTGALALVMSLVPKAGAATLRSLVTGWSPAAYPCGGPTPAGRMVPVSQCSNGSKEG